MMYIYKPYETDPIAKIIATLNISHTNGNCCPIKQICLLIRKLSTPMVIMCPI